MKTIQKLSLLALAGFGGLMCACETPENDAPGDVLLPEVSISDTLYNVGKEGASLVIEVSVINPVDTLDLSVNTEEDWLDVTAGSRSIVVNVDANEGFEAREAVLQVGYGEYFSGTVTIVQDQEIRPEFEITIKDVSATTVTVDVVPTRDDLTYMMRPVRKDVLDTYADDEEFFAAELEYINYMMEDQNTGLLHLRYKYERIDYELKYLDTDSEYVICVYALGDDLSLQSDIFRSEVFRTDEIAFEYTATVDGVAITVDVQASDDKAPFFFDVVSADYLEENGKTVEDAAQYVLDFNFYTGAELWKENIVNYIPNMASYGSASATFESYSMDNYTYENEADADYIVFVSTVNQYGKIGTLPLDTMRVRTDKIYLSENDITLDVSNITSTSWELKITTTVQDDPYVLWWDLASLYEGMTKEDLIAEFSDTSKYNYFWMTWYGDKEFKYTGKNPDTEYAIFVFGWEGGVMTTDFHSVYVKTLPA